MQNLNTHDIYNSKYEQTRIDINIILFTTFIILYLLSDTSYRRVKPFFTKDKNITKLKIFNQVRV